MCGIAGTVGGQESDVERALDAIEHRGPDGRGVTRVGGTVLGHVRLSIIDLSDASAQPFERGRITLAYNGELWNYRDLRETLRAEGETFSTTGDTEVVAAALDRWGIDALPLLDGMFAVAWVDGDRTWLARDRYGEVPLHVGCRDGEAWFASEAKALVAVGCPKSSVALLGPGEVAAVTPTSLTVRRWYEPSIDPAPLDLPAATAAVAGLVDQGTTLRGLAADVPVCSMLSGGIDSAVIALHLAALNPSLVTYTAVLNPRSRDLRCARLVAADLGVTLVEVPVREPTADDLAGVVAEIEMPHKAQVEIGWACLAVADAMRADGFKVAFSGEGSDELWASYGMSYHGIAKDGWHEHRRRLVLDQGRKNFARCNKVFMARSVEVRLPFLHRPLVELALSLPVGAVRDGSRAKAVLQDGYAGRLPAEVCSRPKVAFQDGMGLKEACARAVADPRRFYAAEHRRLYG